MRRKHRFWTLPAFLLALAVTVLPVFHRLAAERESLRQVETLEERVKALGSEQIDHQRNLAKWYNLQLAQGVQSHRGAYGNILDFGDGAMGVLEVPELHLKRVICHGAEGDVGHDPASSFPIGGRGNHTVLILGEQHSWAAGQAVYIDCLGERLSYRVESVQVMPAFWPTDRPAAPEQELLTLVCDRGSTRTIIRCVRCRELTVRSAPALPLSALWLAASTPMVLVLPALLISARGEQRPRICGFSRKNRRKSKLF